MKATGESENPVRGALTEAGVTGAITATGCLHLSANLNLARYFAHPALDNRVTLPPETWGGTISWLESRVGRYDLVRLNRTDIERWLAAAATHKDEQPRAEDSSPRPKKGEKETKVDAIAAFLRDRYQDRPAMSNNEFARAVKEGAQHVGGFSPRVLERAIAKAWPKSA